MKNKICLLCTILNSAKDCHEQYTWSAMVPLHICQKLSGKSLSSDTHILLYKYTNLNCLWNGKAKISTFILLMQNWCVFQSKHIEDTYIQLLKVSKVAVMFFKLCKIFASMNPQILKYCPVDPPLEPLLGRGSEKMFSPFPHPPQLRTAFYACDIWWGITNCQHWF